MKFVVPRPTSIAADEYHLLISAFTARENVMMPMLVDRGFPSADIEKRASDLLVQVGQRHQLSPSHPNLDLARRCDRIIEVVDGRIQGG
jgi:predicted ABC-type transport system involved in lysophospholipase L1 biosynthesis ATPase subunit